ncbi:MAG: hypothetical protein MJA27_05405 [Pseudanabaenales cyanobacterium]|nr:hypothetical protein [Pseudanabaenales cyanobacterium]
MYNRIIRFSWFFVLVGILGCSAVGETRSPLFELNMPRPIARLISRITPIEEIHAQSAPLDHPVYLRGQVQQSIPLLNGRIYQLQDDTGSIWVVTQTSAPIVGEEILIKGLTHYEPILVAGEDLGEHYIEEQEQIQ